MIGLYIVYGISVAACWLIILYGLTLWQESNGYYMRWLEYKKYPDGSRRPRLETRTPEVFVGVAGFSFFPVINTLMVLGFLLWIVDNATRRI